MNDPLAEAPSNAPLSIIPSTRVPNVFPTVEAPYRLAIIGEAPGESEEQMGQPFVGASGRLLDSLLNSVGVLRAACLVGNVCQYRPPGNDIKAYGYDHPRVQEGLQQLKDDLAEFKPNCILALGNTAMWAVTGKPYGVKDSGYSIDSSAGFCGVNSSGVKYVAAYHPAYILRQYNLWLLLRLSCQRALAEAHTPDFTPPVRKFDLDLGVNEICHKLEQWPSGVPASIDIEGGLGGWICLSVVPAHNYGFIIAFGKHSEVEQARLYKAVAAFLQRSDVPKVLQNSLYEGFVLGYGFNMFVANVREDTMLKQWEIYPELAKGLDTVASVWTREPEWKHLIAYSDKEKKRRKLLPGYDPEKEIRNKHLACCIDSAVTLEACDAMSNALTIPAKRHYNFNVELLPPLLYMELRGIKYDPVTAEFELARTQVAIAEVRSRLTLRTGEDLYGKKGSLSDTKLKKLLYEKRGYPVQYKGRGPNKKVTCDQDALLKLCEKRPNDELLGEILLQRRLESIKETLEISADPDGRVRCAYNLVGTETGRLTCYTSPTGSGANLQTITKKLRKLYRADEANDLWQCDLSGADGWTVAARCLQFGDDTMWLDYLGGLKPAKIIALMYKLGAAATQCSREELKARCDAEVDGTTWLYDACKAVQHGSNYGMQEKTMSGNIMKQSYKKSGQAVYVAPNVCGSLQRLYFVRYPGLYKWHNWAKDQVFTGKNLTSASGHTRIFFGRRKSFNSKTRQSEADHETWKEFLADEPQENTTYATNLAIHQLWHDQANRLISYVGVDSSRALSELHHYAGTAAIEWVNAEVQRLSLFSERDLDRNLKGRLLIEPLHQVHDAALGQNPSVLRPWACAKIRSYFQNELNIANQTFVIPFEGQYGPSWGEQGAKYGGGDI